MRLSLSRALRMLKKPFRSLGRGRRLVTRSHSSARCRLFLEPLEDRRLLASDFAITKLDTPDPAAPGTTLTYTIQVTNNGPDAGSAIVADTFPAGFTGVAFTPTAVTATGNTVSGT